MNATAFEPNRRILVIDDNAAIHDDVRKILSPPKKDRAEALASLESEVLGQPVRRPRQERLRFEVDSAHQGEEGLAMLQRALEEGRPYAMAMVDVRMPPGWDGIQTTEALWTIQPDLQVVICTAYTDYSWEEMLERLGNTDQLVVLRKPFDTIEVLQLASCLTQKWSLTQVMRQHAAKLEDRVRIRTADLQHANAALQAEVTRRVRTESDLIRAKESAESAARAKSSFLANMSHEIRTPMNGVIGMANLLTSTPLNAEQADFVQTLTQCCDSLLTIINDILDFSKVEAGRLEFERVDFDLLDAVQLAVDLQGEMAARKSLELVLDVDPAVPVIVRGDAVRLRQVLLNLIGNAVKFTEHGEIVVRVSPEPGAREGETQLRFEISDTGIGIAPGVQSTLFEPFVQADSSTTRRYGGTGLGLAICKRIVELMNGTIGFHSTPGKGSTFWFTVRMEAALECTASITFLPLPVPGAGILVVDDSTASREHLGRLLTRWSARPALADSAAAALEIMRHAAAAGTPFGVVLIDRRMPGIDGLQLAALIRAEPSFGKPLLVLLPWKSERLSDTELAAHGLDACVTKPVSSDVLRNALGRALTRARAAAPMTETRPSPPATLSRERILVADDNPVNQKVMALMLRNLGYDCRAVGNGRDALEALRQSPFALVLMDDHMPELDGVTATRRIREEGAAGRLRVPSTIPIIATTADAMPDTRARCLDAGMNDFLAKPLKVDELAAALASHLTPGAPRHARLAAE